MIGAMFMYDLSRRRTRMGIACAASFVIEFAVTGAQAVGAGLPPGPTARAPASPQSSARATAPGTPV